MKNYFGFSSALSKVVGYRVLHFTFPNGYTAKITRTLEYPGSEDWSASLMHKGVDIYDTAITVNGKYLAKGETTAYISSEEVEAYLRAVKALPVRLR